MSQKSQSRLVKANTFPTYDNSQPKVAMIPPKTPLKRTLSPVQKQKSQSSSYDDRRHAIYRRHAFSYHEKDTIEENDEENDVEEHQESAAEVSKGLTEDSFLAPTNDEPYTAVGSSEDIRNINEVSVSQIVANFKNKNRRNTNRVSLIRKKPIPNRSGKISGTAEFFENYAKQQSAGSTTSLTEEPGENQASDERNVQINVEDRSDSTDGTEGESGSEGPGYEWEIIEVEVENSENEMDQFKSKGLVKNSIFLQRDSRYSDIIDHSDPEDDDDEEEEEEEVREEEIQEGGEGEKEDANDGGSGSPCSLKPSTPTIKVQKTIRRAPVDAVARKLKLIVTEILTTERAYVKKLYLLDEVFQKELTKQCVEEKLVPEKAIREIFSNLSSIHLFHESTLLPELEKRIEEWDSNPKVGDIFKKFGPFLKLYTEFVKNFDNGCSVLNNWLKSNKKFAQVVEEIQKRPESENLALQHHMLGPIQRVPRYKLLLQDYLKKLPDDSPDRKETEESLGVISTAADHANNSMKENEKFTKLLEIEDRIADGMNGETLVTPSRVFIREGEIRKQAARTENTMPRTLMLFNDLLLCCSQTTTGKLSVRQIMDVTGITIDMDDIGLPENGFRVRAKQRVLDLIANNEEERKEWVEAINDAVDHQAALREMRQKKILSAEDSQQNGVSIGEQAPVWVKDEDVTMCMTCAQRFGMVMRKHHCRGCGRVVCDKCSNYRTKLAYLGNELKRICVACSQKITGTSLVDGKPLLESHLKQVQAVQVSVRTRDTKSKPDYTGQVYWKSPGSNWKQHWIELSEFALYIKKKRQDVKAILTHPVPGFEVEECLPSEGYDAAHPYCLKMHRGNKKEFTYHICTDKEDSFTRLLKHLQSAVKAEKWTEDL